MPHNARAATRTAACRLATPLRFLGNSPTVDLKPAVYLRLLASTLMTYAASDAA